MLAETDKRKRIYEWACRLLLSVHFLLVISGYISFLQIKHQLQSPLIPEETLYTIVVRSPDMYVSVIHGVSFLVALWLYFFRYRLGVIIVCSLSIIAHQFLLLYYFR
jgi:hypothetical protein